MKLLFMEYEVIYYYDVDGKKADTVKEAEKFLGNDFIGSMEEISDSVNRGEISDLIHSLSFWLNIPLEPVTSPELYEKTYLNRSPINVSGWGGAVTSYPLTYEQWKKSQEESYSLELRNHEKVKYLVAHLEEHGN